MKMSETEKSVEAIVDSIINDLKKVAQKHGKTIILVACAIYLWKKL